MTKPALTSDEILASDKGAVLTKQMLGTEFLNTLFVFLRATETHDPSNQIFAMPLNTLHRHCLDWCEIFQEDGLLIHIKGEQLFVGDRRIRPKPKNIKRLKLLLKFLKDRGINTVRIPKAVRKEELNVFLWTLSRVKKGSSAVQITEMLRTHGLDHFELKSLLWSEMGQEESSPSELLYEQLYALAKECFSNPNAFKTIQLPSLEQLIYEWNSFSDEDFMSFFCRRSVLPTENPVAHTAVMTAATLFGWGRCLGLPPYVLVELAGCGLSHPFAAAHADPTQDLSVQGRAEVLLRNLKNFEKVWPHTSLQVLALLEFSVPFGEKGVYEIGNRKCYQHIFSRMLRIAALFQNMICADRRRSSLSPSEAIEKLLTSSLGCDRSLVKLFVNWLGLYPVGSFVQLKSGEVAQVVSPNTELTPEFRPQLKVFKNRQGAKLESVTTIDLKAINEKIGIYQNGIQRPLRFDETGLSVEEYSQLSHSISWSSS